MIKKLNLSNKIEVQMELLQEIIKDKDSKLDKVYEELKNANQTIKNL